MGRPSRTRTPVGRALARPGRTGAVIAAAAQVVCAVAAAVHGPLDQGGWPRGAFVVAVAVLGSLATAAARRPGARLGTLALLTGALSFVLLPGELAYVVLSVGLAAIGAHGLDRLQATLDVRRSLVNAERRRAAHEHRRRQRDLHNLLGHSFTSIVAQTELLARRLAEERAPGRAEAAELVSLSRRALAETRAVVSGPRRLDLAAELASAHQVLCMAGIHTEVAVDSTARDPDVAYALAAVLREGVTNVLRHSRARSCRITLRRTSCAIVLTLSNDGSAPAREQRRGGTGLDSLTARLTAVGGTLTWSYEEDWFRLCAVSPTTARGAEASPAAGLPAGAR
ncbi:sensor histidine kinase [Streptomyces sp. SP17KL33]|uniref:sensor histidine kinase n=1 Tax=Streptomyces sp. SP17KL33 TaxID=3002534 RepID=UPI002E763E4A|nr:histidine kinase [Streptomyces sp. SP17KL33]MEE1832674.1 histidine kinase [Streptomyces sp. SP17KL33]